MSQYLFPVDFIWGATTSSYQVEGSPEADGKDRCYMGSLGPVGG